MGQPVTVVERPTSESNVVRFEANRSLTGMGHEYYTSRERATGVRWCDELARRIFDHTAVESIHIYSNAITIKLAAGGSKDGIADVIRTLYIHYKPGVEPAKF